MNHFEVEVKSLIGANDKADELIKKLDNKGFRLKDTNSQLNHYFTGGDLSKLSTNVRSILSADAIGKLESILEKGSDFSIRTREVNQTVLLVIKSSVNDNSSENGTVRMEFEEAIEDLSLDQLDNILLDAGFQYQAKWSRQRREFEKNDISVTVDKNAGYGYLAEFEILVEEEADTSIAHQRIVKLMEELGTAELSQDRLGRMFDYYNENWRDYYGTDKVFTIE